MRSVPIKLMAVAVVAAFASAACGSGGSGVSQPVSGTWDDVVAAAKSEGSVLLYSSQNPANLEALKVAFEQEYPEISLEYVRGTDADINPKVEVENQTKRGTADVHMLTDSAWIETAAESGTYSADLVGPAFDTPEYEPQKSIISDKFFLTSAAVFSLGWNTTALPGGLQKPEDLLDPALKGKIGIVNPSGIASYVDFYRFFEKNFGPDYLQKLAELKPRIYERAGSRPGLDVRRDRRHPGGATPGAGEGIGCARRLGSAHAAVGNTLVHACPVRGAAPECGSGPGELHGHPGRPEGAVARLCERPSRHRRQRRAGPGHRTAQPVRSDARIAHRIPGRLGKAIHPVTSDDARLRDTCALVTGAARGIGAATAELFHAHGATVYLCDVDDDLGNSVAAKLGARAHYRHLDVTDEADWSRVTAEMADRGHPLRILVNSAGAASKRRSWTPRSPSCDA